MLATVSNSSLTLELERLFLSFGGSEGGGGSDGGMVGPEGFMALQRIER